MLRLLLFLITPLLQRHNYFLCQDPIPQEDAFHFYQKLFYLKNAF